MLIISKKKLFLTRFLMWGGLVVVAIGAVISFVLSSYSDAGAFPTYSNTSFLLIVVGFVVSLIGAFCMKRLFRCPKCGKNVLPDSSGIDVRTEKCPERCPNCGTKIQIKE